MMALAMSLFSEIFRKTMTQTSFNFKLALAIHLTILVLAYFKIISPSSVIHDWNWKIPITLLLIVWLPLLPRPPNPCFRELHPQRQFRIERWMLATMRCMRILSYRRPPPLPTEIWAIILEMTIDIPYVFDTTCTPETHPLFHKQWLSIGRDGYHKSDDRRRSLRLVCKMWGQLLPAHSTRWITERKKPGNDIRRIDLSPNGADGYPISWQMDIMRADNGALTKLVSISIRNDNTFHPSNDEPVELLFKWAPSIPTVRALSLSIPATPAQFLRRLGSAFPLLTALSFEIRNLVGDSINLPCLEVLHLDVREDESATWFLPSLLHCSFGHLDMDAGLRRYRPFLQRHAKSLESLSFYYMRGILVLDDAFWRDYPKIQFLGTGAPSLVIQSSPPVDHPFHTLEYPTT